MKISEQIIARLKKDNARYFANDNIANYMSENDYVELQLEVEERVSDLLKSLVIDTDNDHNTKGTAKRVAKMFLREVYKGRYQPPPEITSFPNDKHLDEVYTVGPITVRSACSHHLVPIIGQAWVGVIPSDQVIGISKFHRLSEWVLSRPQIQEEATVMLADHIQELINPKALAVVIRASHLCMTWRGVRENETSMVTSVMRGAFRDNAEVRAEFFSLTKGQGL